MRWGRDKLQPIAEVGVALSATGRRADGQVLIGAARQR